MTASVSVTQTDKAGVHLKEIAIRSVLLTPTARVASV